jgi:hypothetical protein
MELSKQRAATDSANFVKERKFSNNQDRIAGQVRPDDTTAPEKRGGFAPSVATRVLDKNPGWSGDIRPTMEDHQGDKGLGTLSSDSRMMNGKTGSPLPEDGVKLNIHGRRRDEHVVGRSMDDVNDDNTVYGQDLAPDVEGFKKEKRDIIKVKGKRDV